MCSPEVMARVQNSILRHGRTTSRRQLLGASGAVAAAGLLAPFATVAQNATPVATPVAPSLGLTINSVVSLSHVLTPESPVWPGNDPFMIESVVTIEEDGFYGNRLTVWEHTGTHVDAPAHFFADGATADLIDPRALIAPLAVIDITAKADADDDASVAVDDILAWEAEYGELPAGAFVAFTSGWDARFDDPEAFVNLDTQGVMHFPGFSPDAATFLVEERSIVGIGSDTLSQDPGNSTDFGAHIAILGSGRYGIEGIANLGDVPASGSAVFVGSPNHGEASGGLTRLLAAF